MIFNAKPLRVVLIATTEKYRVNDKKKNDYIVYLLCIYTCIRMFCWRARLFRVYIIHEAQGNCSV